MLPLFFAALVWPARRVWAVRAIELLIALILSKFVIVAVLSLAGAAYGQSGYDSVSRALTAMSLLLLSTFAPWTMMRLLPFTEVAASAAGALRQEVPQLQGRVTSSYARASSGSQSGDMEPGAAQPEAAAASLIAARMRTQAEKAFELGPGDLSRTAGTGGGGDATSPAPEAGSADGPEPATEADEERLPGMEPIWQAENGAWPPLNLGPGGWGGPTDYRPPDEDSDEELTH
jgi:hypothetical protein